MKTRFFFVVALLLLAAVPVRAQVLHGTFATGSGHSLAIHADGSLWASGQNSYGQLGNGTTTSAAGWVQVGTDKDWAQVACGGNSSLALKTNGTAWAWGDNTYGQLGDGTNSNRSVPTAVAGGGTYIQLAASGSHSLGLRADGTAWAWGFNLYSQLSDGTTTNRSSPVAVGGGGTYTQLAVGDGYSLGLRANGSAWGWGFNAFGQLGDGSTTSRSVPTALAGARTYAFADAQAQAAAYYRLAQTDADGRVRYSPLRFVPTAETTENAAATGRIVLVPNPARTLVQVPGTPADAALTIYNAVGQRVRTARGGTLDVAGLPAGVYLVRGSSRTARLVVE